MTAKYAGHHGWLLGWLRRRLGSAADAANLGLGAGARYLGRVVLATLRYHW